jgi:hypothetical protein
VALWEAVPRVEGLVHRQRTLVVPQRLAERALVLEHKAQIVKGRGQVGVALGVAVLGVKLLVDLKRFPELCDCRDEVALLIGLPDRLIKLRGPGFELLSVLGRGTLRRICRLAR